MILFEPRTRDPVRFDGDREREREKESDHNTPAVSYVRVGACVSAPPAAVTLLGKILPALARLPAVVTLLGIIRFIHCMHVDIKWFRCK